MGFLSDSANMFGSWLLKNTGFSHQTAESKWLANREDTAYQRKVEDLKAAGLSPVLAADGTGASSSAPISSNQIGSVASTVVGKALDIPGSVLGLLNSVGQVREHNAQVGYLNSLSNEADKRAAAIDARLPYESEQAAATLADTQANTAGKEQDTKHKGEQADFYTGQGYGPLGPSSNLGAEASDLSSANPTVKNIYVHNATNQLLTNILHFAGQMLNSKNLASNLKTLGLKK